jgi:hypothetical protein
MGTITHSVLHSYLYHQSTQGPAPNIIAYAIDNSLVRIQYDLSRLIVACGDDGETG